VVARLPTYLVRLFLVGQRLGQMRVDYLVSAFRRSLVEIESNQNGTGARMTMGYAREKEVLL
jgi:hypothetical protein